MRREGLLSVVALLSACGTSFDPESYVDGLRVLAIKAEPPEAAPGQSTTLTALAVDTAGSAITVSWTACTEPPLTGAGPIHQDCFDQDAAPYLIPMGTGLSVTGDIPDVTPSDFGPPDAGGGLYLPIRVQARSASGAVDAAYELRLAQGAPPNHNPQLLGVLTVPAVGPPAPLEEASPLEMHAGDEVTLRAVLSDDSAETYALAVAGQSSTATEIVSVSWFATGGSLSESVTGQPKPDTVWRADKHLPPAGTVIDLYVVAHDERGGTDYLHRSVLLK